MNFTTTEIKPVETTLEVLTQYGIELDLDTVLEEEIFQGLANDISNPL